MENSKAKALRAKIGEVVGEYAAIALQPFLPGATVALPSGKLLGETELKSMVHASLDGWLTTGDLTKSSRRNWRLHWRKASDHCELRSSANLLAFSTLTSPKLGVRAIQKGDEVIGVAAGFSTTVNPSLQFDVVPVFVDVDCYTHNIDTSKIEAIIGPKTKAMMLAHSQLGQPL